MDSKMFEGYSYNRRDETATPLCGTHRQPTKNALLTKAQLGCVRGTSYDLPEDFGFTYGMANKSDGLTAGKVVDNWAVHTGTLDQKPAKDFKATNKKAVVAGNTTAKSVRDFALNNDIRVRLPGETQLQGLPIDENTTFGAPARPSTPFGDLLAHGFRYDWMLQADLAEDLGCGKKPLKLSQTKSSKLLATASAARKAEVATYPSPLPDESTWKMKKFREVKSRYASA